MFKILRAADYRRMAWKNGKGETVEIAVFPPNASVNDFDWRISMAAVVEDGEFSLFEGIDRTLSVLSGEGIELSVEGETPVTLRRDTPPHAFAADAPTSATLLSGPITDLNVMTRRGKLAHRVTVMTTLDSVAPAQDAVAMLVLTLGDCELRGEGTKLGPLDAVLIEKGGPPIGADSFIKTTYYVIEIFRV
jgi:environmental stress-induced protein Ves